MQGAVHARAGRDVDRRADSRDRSLQGQSDRFATRPKPSSFRRRAHRSSPSSSGRRSRPAPWSCATGTRIRRWRTRVMVSGSTGRPLRVITRFANRRTRSRPDVLPRSARPGRPRAQTSRRDQPARRQSGRVPRARACRVPGNGGGRAPALGSRERHAVRGRGSEANPRAAGARASSPRFVGRFPEI